MKYVVKWEETVFSSFYAWLNTLNSLKCSLQVLKTAQISQTGGNGLQSKPLADLDVTAFSNFLMKINCSAQSHLKMNQTEAVNQLDFNK